VFVPVSNCAALQQALRDAPPRFFFKLDALVRLSAGAKRLRKCGHGLKERESDNRVCVCASVYHRGGARNNISERHPDRIKKKVPRRREGVRVHSFCTKSLKQRNSLCILQSVLFHAIRLSNCSELIFGHCVGRKIVCIFIALPQ